MYVVNNTQDERVNHVVYSEESLKLHKQLHGKIEVVSRTKVNSEEALALAYTPGVAQPSTGCWHHLKVQSTVQTRTQ